MASKEEDVKNLQKYFERELRRREEAVWANFWEEVVTREYYGGEYTHDEVRDAIGMAFEDPGYDRFDEEFGYVDPNEDD